MPGPWEKYRIQPATPTAPGAPQGPWGQFAAPAPGSGAGPADDASGPPGGGFEPGSIGDYLEALQQGAVLDPAEKIGGMAENLPGALGRGARAVGAALPASVQRFLDENRAAGERHPWVRTAGNVLPWLAVPGGEGVAGDILFGTISGGLQPLDPNDPHFWRHTAGQAAGGAALAGTVGTALRGVGGSTAASSATNTLAGREAELATRTRAYNAAVDKLNSARQARYESETARVKAINDGIAEVNATARARFEAAQAARRDTTYQNRVADHSAAQERAAIPERTTRETWQRVYTEAGMPDRAPQTIGFGTAAAVRNDIGARIGGIFQRMHVSGTDPALQQRLLGIIQSTNQQLAGSSAAMQNLWRTTVGQKLIYPFLRRPDMTGEELGNFMSALKREAEGRGLAAQNNTEDPRAQRLVAHGLRDMIDAIENQADRLNPTLGRQRRALNRAYTLTNIAGDALRGHPDNNGIFGPDELLRAWERHDGFWRFGGDARMLRMKQLLQERVRAMETPPARAPDAPIQPPGHVPREPQPDRPGRWPRATPETSPRLSYTRPGANRPPTPANVPTSSAPSAGGAAAEHAIVHALHAMTGVPRAAARAIVGASRDAAAAAGQRASRFPRQAAAGSGAVAGQVMAPDMVLPPVTITAPAPPWMRRQPTPGDLPP